MDCSVLFTVAHLSLSVGADDLEVPGGHEETVHLLWGGLVEQRGQEHPQMEIKGFWPVWVHTARATQDRGQQKREAGGNVERARREMVR